MAMQLKTITTVHATSQRKQAEGPTHDCKHLSVLRSFPRDPAFPLTTPYQELGIFLIGVTLFAAFARRRSAEVPKCRSAEVPKCRRTKE